MGDFNARTGTINQSLSNEGNQYIQDQSESSFQTKKRESFDPVINNHGKCLLEICKNNDLLES